MNAQIGIDETGRPYIALANFHAADVDMLRYMRSFLPLVFGGTDGVPAGEVRIIGERLPGSGKAVP